MLVIEPLIIWAQIRVTVNFGSRVMMKAILAPMDWLLAILELLLLQN